MDSLSASLKVFKSSLPPALEAYGTEILVTTLVATIVTFIFLGWQCLCRRTRGRTVCLLGLSNSGKTLLFLQLTQGRYGPTQNSIVVNICRTYKSSDVKNGKPVILVDIPGNERVRERFFSSYKDSLRGVVVVIDSLNFPSELHDLAELLYDLLSDPALHRARAPVLLACNKQDIALAISVNSIREDLEKEMTQLQVSRRAKLSSLEGGSKAQKPIEFIKKGKDFRFADLPSWMGVQAVTCSGHGNDAGREGGVADIKAVQEWIDKLCF